MYSMDPARQAPEYVGRSCSNGSEALPSISFFLSPVMLQFLWPFWKARLRVDSGHDDLTCPQIVGGQIPRRQSRCRGHLIAV